MADVNAPERGVVNDVCARMLLPAAPMVATPGFLFMGYVMGTRSSHFAIAPAVALSAGASIPWLRPSLWISKDDDGKVRLRLPQIGVRYLNAIVSANAAVAGVIYPNASEQASSTADLGFSLGAYGGIETGMIAFTRSGVVDWKVAFTAGIVAGYLGNSATVGNAMIVGIQPGFVASF